MRVAREFGLDPRLVAREWTNRELRTAERWIDDQMSVPGRTDFYMMQIAREVAMVLCGKETRDRVSLNDFRLRFSRDGEDRKTGERDEVQKQLFIGILSGAGISKETITKTEARERAKEIQVGVRP